MNRLWTPDHGPSGLIVVAKARPLILVMGGQLIENTPAPIETARPLRETRSPGGLIILRKGSDEPRTRVVGHPDLAINTRYRRGQTLYVSVSEAVWRESQGEDVEIHFEPDDDDRSALSDIQDKVRRRWDNDRLPDGWTGPASRNRTRNTPDFPATAVQRVGSAEPQRARDRSRDGDRDPEARHFRDTTLDAVRAELLANRDERLRARFGSQTQDPDSV